MDTARKAVMKSTPAAMVVSVVLISASTAWAQQARPDLKGSKDHPLIPRYAGSYIAEYAHKAFEEYYLPLGVFGGERPKEQRLEGKYTRILYYFPADRSTLEVMRNYDQALANAGFKVLFRCAHADCTVSAGWKRSRTLGSIYPQDSRYVAAKLSRPAGDVYAAVHVRPEHVYLDVLEVAGMEEKMITIDAATIAGDITRTGHASIYGIQFDTDKAELRPSSDAVLREIGKMMKENPDLRLLVVGHTDSTGSFEHNLDLSRRRADAVARALTARYGVAATRLKAQGAGPIAPVATNRTEAGKALNRRVELVEQ